MKEEGEKREAREIEDGAKRWAFPNRSEGVMDDLMLLSPTERKLVAYMVFYKGNEVEVGEQMGIGIEGVHEGMDPRKKPWMWRAVEYFYNRGPELLKAINRGHVFRAQLQEIDKLWEGKDTPPETRRKLIRDVMEADPELGFFPKMPGVAIQSNQTVVVMGEPPEWAKKKEKE